MRAYLPLIADLAARATDAGMLKLAHDLRELGRVVRRKQATDAAMSAVAAHLA